MKTISKIYQPFGGGDRKEEKGELGEGGGVSRQSTRVSPPCDPGRSLALEDRDPEGDVADSEELAGKRVPLKPAASPVDLSAIYAGTYFSHILSRCVLWLVASSGWRVRLPLSRGGGGVPPRRCRDGVRGEGFA